MACRGGDSWTERHALLRVRFRNGMFSCLVVVEVGILYMRHSSQRFLGEIREGCFVMLRAVDTESQPVLVPEYGMLTIQKSSVQGERSRARERRKE